MPYSNIQYEVTHGLKSRTAQDHVYAILSQAWGIHNLLSTYCLTHKDNKRSSPIYYVGLICKCVAHNVQFQLFPKKTNLSEIQWPFLVYQVDYQSHKVTIYQALWWFLCLGSLLNPTDPGAIISNSFYFGVPPEHSISVNNIKRWYLYCSWFWHPLFLCVLDKPYIYHYAILSCQ